MFTALIVTVVATMPSRVKAQDLANQNLITTAAMQRARQDYQQGSRTDALRQQIARDRSGVVADLMSRWAAQIGGAEKGRVGFETRFMTADPEILLKMALAGTWDEIVAASLGVGVNVLGSTIEDLVFNPVTPCRVLDTRFGTGPYAGPYSHLQTVSFYVTDALDKNGHNQGGAPACGFPFAVGAGVALNITVSATGPGAGGGDLKIFPYGGAEPNSSIVNFEGGTNTANAADIAIALANPGNDVTIRVEYATNVHLIVDIMGYYAAPHATTLDTFRVVSPTTAAPLGLYTVDTPSCPVGYVLTGGGFNETLATAGGNWILQDGPIETLPSTFWRVRGRNNTPAPLSLTVYGICNRMPGR
jgi:hypothetical protein